MVRLARYVLTASVHRRLVVFDVEFDVTARLLLARHLSAHKTRHLQLAHSTLQYVTCRQTPRTLENTQSRQRSHLEAQSRQAAIGHAGDAHSRLSRPLVLLEASRADVAVIVVVAVQYVDVARLVYLLSTSITSSTQNVITSTSTYIST